MYRFALRPWWILSHVVVVAIAVLFTYLGFWQLARHDDRVEQNEKVVARTAEDPVPVGELAASGEEPSDLRYRPVTAVGEFMVDADLFVDNRSFEGHPGAWVVTPLRLEDGAVVAVSRGFLPASDVAEGAPAPPSGPVAVSGTAIEWDGDCGIRSDDAERPVGAACLSRDAVETLAGGSTLDIAVQMTASNPPDSSALFPVPLPELDDGPHRSYAAQWFLFMLVGVITYPLILRRVARHREIAPAEAAESADSETR